MINFTKISNPIIDDFSLSDKAFRIYSMIAQFQSLEGFKVYKGFLAKKVNYSVKTLERVIRELKEKGLVKLNRIRKGKAWEYFYSLNNGEVQEEAPKKEAKKEVVAKNSDGNTPIDGQVHINEFVEGEVLEVEKEATKEGLNADLEVIRKAIEVANNYDKKITNRTKFILGTIRNLLTNKKTSKSNPNFKKQKSLSCHNFSQREYDWDSLENELLGYGLNDSVNELDSVPQLPSFIGSAL